MNKKIHYCWFGGNPLPDDAIKCINSWKEYCPDYEIVQWDESNFDVHSIPYIHEAYEQGKFAFVSDYARFQILYQHGGLYFDVDVELIRPMDEIIGFGPYMGAEVDGGSDGKMIAVNPGVGFMANPHMELLEEIIDAYKGFHFLNEDGTLNTKTIVEYTTEILVRHGLQNSEKIQDVAGFRIYPSEYFCPINYFTGEFVKTSNTYSIHHFNSSWMTDLEKRKHEEIVFFSKKIGRKLARRYVLAKYAFAENGIQGVGELIKKKLRLRK